MSTIQGQIINSLEGLSDDNLQFLLDFITRFMRAPIKTEDAPKKRTLGICSPQELYADDYDIDEDNAKIAEIFGVMS